MLALSAPKAFIVAFLVFTSCTGLTMAQQTPASRYQPVAGPQASRGVTKNFQDGRTPPPSVHVPPASAQRIGSSVGYQFSDEGLPASSSMNTGKKPPASIRQTAFLSDENQAVDPSIPDILRRRSEPGIPPTANDLPSNPQSNSPRTSSDFLPQSETPTVGQIPQTKPLPSPADFSSQMKQMRDTPRVAPEEIDRVAQIRQDVEAIQRKIAERNQATTGSAQAPAAASSTPSRASFPASSLGESAGESSIPAEQQVPFSPSQQNPIPERLDQVNSSQDQQGFSPFQASERTPLRQPENESFEVKKFQESPVSSGQIGEESFDQFMAEARDSETDQESSDGSTEVDNPANVNVPASYQSSDRFADHRSQGRTEEPRQPNTAIRLAAPALSVETFGPQSIGINRPCDFTIMIRNDSQQLAERVMISIDFPSWVEIDKVNLTTGEREIVDVQPMQRLLWKIDRVPAMASQSITITAIPRRAEVFDLGVEWTLVPRAGAAKIQVTQPKLEMSIVGPDEVQFGESVAYDVTLRNTGNGEAENVIVMLSEALNGDRGNLGNIPAGGSKVFTVNLFARTPGELELAIQAAADNDSQTSASRKLMIRRAKLEIEIKGPSMRYAGTHGHYTIQVRNSGDARAEEIVAAMGLPKGVRFIDGIESFKLIDGGLRWSVGSLDPGQSREYKVQCQLNASGELQLEVGAQAKGALQASHAVVTQVQTIADLVMIVNDPPGPLTTGEEINYEIVVHNRGTRAAKDVDVFMILSQGLEPKSGSGRDFRIPRDGAIQFSTIPQIDPGEKVTLNVVAVAYQPGTHVFRAHLVCEEADSREIKEGTSRFFGDEIPNARGSQTATETKPTSDFPAEILR